MAADVPLLGIELILVVALGSVDAADERADISLPVARSDAEADAGAEVDGSSDDADSDSILSD